MLTRMVKRRSLLESGDPQEVLTLGFCNRDGTPDLSPSTYDVESAELTRMRSEHCAGANMDRPSKSFNLDVSGLHSTPTRTAANSWFSFVDNIHFELPFATVADLMDFIGRLIVDHQARGDRPQGRLLDDVSERQCEEHVRSAAIAGVAEWTRFLSEHPKGPSWRSRCRIP